MTTRTHPPNIQLTEPDEGVFLDTSVCITPAAGIIRIQIDTNRVLNAVLLYLVLIVFLGGVLYVALLAVPA